MRSCKSGDLLKWKCLFIFGIGMNGFSMCTSIKPQARDLRKKRSVFLFTGKAGLFVYADGKAKGAVRQ